MDWDQASRAGWGQAGMWGGYRAGGEGVAGSRFMEATGPAESQAVENLAGVQHWG